MLFYVPGVSNNVHLSVGTIKILSIPEQLSLQFLLKIFKCEREKALLIGKCPGIFPPMFCDGRISLRGYFAEARNTPILAWIRKDLKRQLFWPILAERK